MIKNFLKIALRNMLRHKVFSFINIVGLATGMASCMFIGLYLHHELSYDTQHPDVERMYQVGTVFVKSDGESKTAATPAPLAQALRQEFPEIASTTRIVGLFAEDKTLLQHRAAGSKQQTFYETGGYLGDSSFFDFFAYPFVEGSPAHALDKPNSIVLCESIARKMFGGQPALNQTLHVESNTNGDADYVVTGVFADQQSPTHLDVRFIMSFVGGGLEAYTKQQVGMAGNNFMFTYLKLKPQADAQRLEAKFPAFVDKYMGKDLQAAAFGKKQFLTPVSDIHLFTDLSHNVTPNGSLTYLYILASIAFFTMLIACINFMNLSTARSSKRSNEVGVRKVLGAHPASLVRQFLSESVLYSISAFVLSVILVWLLLPVFEQVSGKVVHLSAMQLLLFGGGFGLVSLLVGLLAGVYPAFYLTSFKPIMVLKGKMRNSLAAVSIRKGLVVVQFTISIVLIIASLVIVQQMRFLRSADLGFVKERQIIVPLRSVQAKQQHPAFKTAIARHAQISHVGASAYYPGLFNPEDANFYGEKQTNNDAKRTRTNRVDFDYLNTMGIRVVAGRAFSKAFLADTNQRIVLNEEAVRQMGYRSAQAAVGRRVYTERNGQRVGFEVVGVVRDFHFEDLHVPITPYAFTLNESLASINYNYLVIRTSQTSNLSQLLAQLEADWRILNPNEPFEYSFLDEEFQKNYTAENRLSSIVAYFTLIAILISCLGLFGLSSFNAEQRTKEIGIRKVLGASTFRIVKLLATEYLYLIGISILLASPIAWFAMNRWLQDFAYRTQIGWAVFVLTAATALLIAILTMGYQSVKAALTNPVKNLRTE